MSERMSAMVDVLLTGWVVVVGIIYFGGYFLAPIGNLTPAGAALYALMVVLVVVVHARRALPRGEQGAPSAGRKRRSP